MIQGISGLMSITGQPDEIPGGGPVKVGVAISDLFTGMYATTAVLAALAHRERGGGGQYIDMALLDCQVAVLANQSMNYLTTGVSPGRLGNAHPNIVPYQVFATADGHIIIAVGNDSQYRRFCDVIGRPDLATDVAYADNGARVKNRVNLVAAISETIGKMSSEHLQAALDEAVVPWGPINSLDQLFADPQAKARGLRLEWSKWRRPDPATAPTTAKAAGLYMICTMSKHAAEAKGCSDALMFDYRGYIAEATGANIFFVKNGEVHTPTPDCFLNGLTRQTVIGMLKERNIKVVERHIMPDELPDFEQCWLTGTAAEVTPVGQIGDYSFEVGALTREVSSGYEKLVRA